MHSENSNTDALLLSAVHEVQQKVDFGDIKQLTMEMYQNAQLSEQFGMSPQERFDNFYMFKLLYNMLLLFEMQFQPELTGVNTM